MRIIKPKYIKILWESGVVFVFGCILFFLKNILNYFLFIFDTIILNLLKNTKKYKFNFFKKNILLKFIQIQF
jgi:hypothetical protein